MKDMLMKISTVLKSVFGYGMLISLGSGIIMLVGYITALAIGGDVAAAICAFIYKSFIPVVIYGTSLLMLIGLIAMYLGGEASGGGKKKDAGGKS